MSITRVIPIDKIEANPNQPRKFFDSKKLGELIQSIKQVGILQAPLVRPIGNKYQIVIGEMRYRASKEVGLTEIECKVRELTDEEAFEISLHENLERNDLTPVEEARAYKTMLSTGLTQTKLAKRFGKTQGYIANKLRMLNFERPALLSVAWLLGHGHLSEGHARQLLRMEDFIGRLATTKFCLVLHNEPPYKPGMVEGADYKCVPTTWVDWCIDQLAWQAFSLNLTVAGIKELIDGFYFDIVRASFGFDTKEDVDKMKEGNRKNYLSKLVAWKEGMGLEVKNLVDQDVRFQWRWARSHGLMELESDEMSPGTIDDIEALGYTKEEE